MQIIKLNAIDSTNRYLHDLVEDVSLQDYASVTAEYQTDGRGQRGAKWYSEEGKNLIISILKKNITAKIHQQFYLNMRVSLAIYHTLNYFKLPKLSVKWPNDILSGHKKIAGVLIECPTKKNSIRHAIIGIGINVNQTHFIDLQQASSMKKLLGSEFNIMDIMELLTEKIRFYFENFDDKVVKIAYEKILFRSHKPSTFLDHNGIPFTGIIIGVSEDGRLKIQTESSERLFDLKTISMVY